MKQLLHNWLLVESSLTNDTFELGGKTLYVASNWNEGEHASCTGIVKHIGNKTKGIQVGDQAIFPYIHSWNAQDRSMMIDGMMLIEEKSITLIIRDGEIILREPSLIVAPVIENIKTTLLLPDAAKKYSTTQGVIIASWDEEQFPTGATINYAKHAWQPFQHDLHKLLWKDTYVVNVNSELVNVIYDTLDDGKEERYQQFQDLVNFGEAEYNPYSEMKKEYEHEIANPLHYTNLKMAMGFDNLKIKEQDPCRRCGKTIREQMNGCNKIDCYRQYLSKQTE